MGIFNIHIVVEALGTRVRVPVELVFDSKDPVAMRLRIGNPSRVRCEVWFARAFLEEATLHNGYQGEGIIQFGRFGDQLNVRVEPIGEFTIARAVVSRFIAHTYELVFPEKEQEMVSAEFDMYSWEGAA